MSSLKNAKKKEKPRVKLADWLAKQPWSTKRGVARGNFRLPEYVIA
jgi:hypothetical protein